jgi:hypothetical protein
MPQTLYPSLSAPAPPAPWFAKRSAVRQGLLSVRRERKSALHSRRSCRRWRPPSRLPAPATARYWITPEAVTPTVRLHCSATGSALGSRSVGSLRAAGVLWYCEPPDNPGQRVPRRPFGKASERWSPAPRCERLHSCAHLSRARRWSAEQATRPLMLSLAKRGCCGCRGGRYLCSRAVISGARSRCAFLRGKQSLSFANPVVFSCHAARGPAQEPVADRLTTRF